MDLIREIAKAPYDGIDYETRLETANWLIDHTTPEMEDVDLRSLFKCFSLRCSSVISDDEWQTHAAEQLGIDGDIITATEIANETDTVAEAARQFAERTHHPTEHYFELNGDATELTLVEELLETHDQPKQVIDEYTELTGNSRKTYYRRRNSL